MSCRNEELLVDVSTALEKRSIENTWHSTAACIYRNWLSYICVQKQLNHDLKGSDIIERTLVSGPTG